jgi:hypothetical protein
VAARLDQIFRLVGEPDIGWWITIHIVRQAGLHAPAQLAHGPASPIGDLLAGRHDMDGVGETAKQPFSTSVPSLVDRNVKWYDLAFWLSRDHSYLTR